MTDQPVVRFNVKHIGRARSNNEFFNFFDIRVALKDKSSWFLIGANIIIIIYAYFENWGLGDLLWVYWFQSIIIGFFYLIKIILLKNYNAGKSILLGRTIESEWTVKIFSIIFFPLHYGIFHFVYFQFLYERQALDMTKVIYPVFLFLLNHFFSFIYNYQKDRSITRDLKKIMEYPYFRILPMHFIAIIVTLMRAENQFLVVTFLILKTFADVQMHNNEHSIAVDKLPEESQSTDTT